ncbi:ATP-binding protein [Flavobacterium franklandianum]|uniref:ATP-binding protein n=1 Tax=Flavobacterium franklandianum TaxID=2594430 RepID=A0A553CK98_9FLAO|nr:ATP-binding protein [Flavobacterium franklandianum]TRX20924.1 ATP-binding protein [Flavobacterium franklandianum]
MHDFIQRTIEDTIKQYLKIFPVVAVLGPRQCGKSTLVKRLCQNWGDSLFLDLQYDIDLSKLDQPSFFFESNADKIICLDEIQLVPQLFSVLRSVVDRNRQNGKFILLGSASRDLIQQTSESLAGRIGLVYLAPFTINELNQLEGFCLNTFWLRGGFPDSYLSDNDGFSEIWRTNFIKTFIERDIPQLGFQIPALQLKRLLVMCAHNQGQLINYSKLGESLGLTHPTIRRYIDLLEQTFILRTVLPYETNVKKRLVKSPKVFVRDSGLLHQLLSIPDFNSLLGNPVFGSSWEGVVVENIIVNKPDWNYYFYRTATGDEMDLILEKGNQRIAIECKASTAPKLTKGFYRALEVIKPQKTYVIIPAPVSYEIAPNVTVCGLSEFLNLTF